MLLLDNIHERNSFSMRSITQYTKCRRLLVEFAIKHSFGRASRRYNRARSYIYFWLNRYDGSLDSLACRSRRPHSHPNQHTEEEKPCWRNRRPASPKVIILNRAPSAGFVRPWGCGSLSMAVSR